LSRVDLPTLGRPRMATKPEWCVSDIEISFLWEFYQTMISCRLKVES
jgi:hypothetical protein